MASTFKLPIGYDDLGKILANGIDIVDKSLFIKDIIDDPAEVVLITRPRRFGKTLGMSWLRYFFAETVLNQKTADIWNRFKIAKEAEYMAHQGQYPVIALTLKDIKSRHYSETYEDIRELLAQLYLEHRYLIESDQLSVEEKASFQAVLNSRANTATVKNALRYLTRYLYQHHGKKPVVLIDEYDTPIQHAYVQGYYEDMADWMRSCLGALLKNNPYLHKAVLTGILRVAKESLFSGLNNLVVYSMFNDRYAKYFGFTEEEVDDVMQRANFTKHDRAELKHWYNGYQVGHTIIYNPWSVVCAMRDHELMPYWVNTSNNDLIKVLMAKADVSFKQKLESLLRNEPIDGLIDESIVFRHIDGDETSLLSLLFSAGYLKAIQAERESECGIRCQLLAPNYEILLLYKGIVENWFSVPMGETAYQHFLKNLVTGQIEKFTEQLQTFLEKSASYFDVEGSHPEKFYHGFVLGLITSLEKTHQVKSNKESGDGRYDVMLIPNDKSQLGLILEFKTAKKDEILEQTAQQALTQIQNMHYAAELQQMGITRILNVGLAFKGKAVHVISL